MNENILLNVDSYKASHWLQYPPNTTKVFSYIESRGGEYDKTVFFGLQIFLKEYMSKPITREMIEEAATFLEAHGEPFNRVGWEYILDVHNGYLPLIIKAVPEGTVIDTRNALVTVENTDDMCYWLTSYVETALLRAVWYGTTVATNSWHIKQTIKKYLDKTGDPDTLSWKLQDFGARGVSSFESAGIAGAAHLVNFMGSDTITGILFAKKYYNTHDMVGFSIPAAEHSSITTWGKANEVDAYRNMIKQFAKPGSLVAVVSDSYDIYTAVEDMWGGLLKQEVLDSGATIIIRPDSGDPVEVVLTTVKLLDKTFGSTMNDKGYLVLNPAVRVIQGDGINGYMIDKILDVLTDEGYSADNVGFGMGGALLQQVNRDTLKFAMKASAAMVDGMWVDVYKDPVTDSGKTSKKGRLMLYCNILSGQYVTLPDEYDESHLVPMLQTVYLDGKLLDEITFEEVRYNSQLP